MIKQDMVVGQIRTDADLEAQVRAFSTTPNLKGMQGDDLKRPLFFGIVTSALVTYSVIGVLAFLAFG